MSKHSYGRKKLAVPVKQIPKGGASDLSRAISNYKAKEKAQGRAYTKAEERRITAATARTLRNKKHGTHEVHPSQK